MACNKEILILISAYADGESTHEETASAVLHLADCAECRNLVKEWQAQRQMLEWAYMVELSTELGIADIERLAGENKQMVHTGRISRLRLGLMPHWNWARSGIIAALLVMAFTAYHYISTPPMMNVGTPMESNIRPMTVRVDGNVQLRLGPDTIARRTDSSSIRLDKGWASVSVRHGNSFRIITDRMEVSDRGTVFQVGTGPVLDYVMVEEGEVSVAKGGAHRRVGAGQILIAQDKGQPIVASLPRVAPGKGHSPLSPPNGSDHFTPTDSRSLDWSDKYNRLAQRFPEAGMGNGKGGGASSQYGLETWYYFSMNSNFQYRLSEHYQDIAQAMAGGKIENGKWEIPVGVMFVHDISSVPGLSGDMFYVRLVPKDGSIVWRLDGLDGSHADIPLIFGKLDRASGHSSYSEGHLLNHSLTTLENGRKYSLIHQISAWPGELKPILKLTMGSTPLEESHRAEYAMLDEVARKVGKPISDFREARGMSTLLYLDPGRKHRILIAWFDTGSELCRLNDLIRQNRGGSATLGAISTDMPLSEPNVGPGIYLLRLVAIDASQSPYFEITEPDMRYVPAWHGTSFRLPNDPNERGEGKGTWSPGLVSPYKSDSGNVNIEYETSSANENGFPFGFGVTGRPDGKIGVDKTWAKGWIRVKKP